MLAADAGVALAAEVSSSETHSEIAVESSSIVMVDAQLDGLDVLLSDIGDNASLVLLDPSRDLIDQISETLSKHRKSISQLHLVTHGQSGSVVLGEQVIDRQALTQRAHEIDGWSESLTDDADILIYGCRTADGPMGESFVNMLAKLSRADVAASTDRTGRIDQDADWDLEFNVGRIESALVFDTSSRYHHTLDITVNAWGRTGQESFDLVVDNQVVQNWNVQQQWQQYTYQTDAAIDPSRVEIRFTNDLYQPEIGVDRNLHVDNIVIDGTKYETESSSTLSTGTWLPDDGIATGLGRGEVLHTNGSFFYAQNSPVSTIDFDGRTWQVNNAEVSVVGGSLSVTPTNGQDGVLWTSIELTPGDESQLSVTGEADFQGAVGIDFFDSGGNEIAEALIALPAFDEAIQSVDFTVPAEATRATAWIWVDNDFQSSASISDITIGTPSATEGRPLGEVLDEYNQNFAGFFPRYSDEVFVDDAGREYRFAGDLNDDTSSQEILVVRLNSDGSADTSFGNNGLGLAPLQEQVIPVTDRDLQFWQRAGSPDPRPTTSTTRGLLGNARLAFDSSNDITIVYDLVANNTGRNLPEFSGIVVGTAFTKLTNQGFADTTFGNNGQAFVPYQQGTSILVREVAFDDHDRLFVHGPKVDPFYTVPSFGLATGVASESTTLLFDGTSLTESDLFSFRTDLDVFSDQSQFLAANPGLQLEDFETPVVGDQNIRFEGKLSSETSNQFIAPGDIAEGIVIGLETDQLIIDPALTINGSFESQILNTPGGMLARIEFTQSVSAVAFDAYSLVNPIFDHNGSIEVDVYGSQRLLNTYSIQSQRDGANNTPAFIGLVSPDELITRIDVRISDAVWGLDNLYFG